MRLFDEHTMRECKSLDGTWKFRVDEKDEGISCEWEKGLPDGAGTVVPSVWNSDKGLLNYEGAAWYEKSFYSSGGTLRFVFGAVMTAARIWLDGELLGEHYGGFCEFSFVRRGVKSGVHTLTVRADNRFDEDSIPQKYVDWWHYGGIIRSVTVERLEGICVLYAKTEYKLSDDLHTAFIKQRAELYNAAESAITDSVRL